jgi:hypothetical protein
MGRSVGGGERAANVEKNLGSGKRELPASLAASDYGAESSMFPAASVTDGDRGIHAVNQNWPVPIAARAAATGTSSPNTQDSPGPSANGYG